LGLPEIRALGAQRFIIKSDTQMNTGPVEKEYMAREPELATRHTYLYTGYEQTI